MIRGHFSFIKIATGQAVFNLYPGIKLRGHSLALCGRSRYDHSSERLNRHELSLGPQGRN